VKTVRDGTGARHFLFSKGKEKSLGKALLGKLRSGLKKTRDRLTSGIVKVLTGKGKIDEELLEELEATFLQADIGVKMTSRLVDSVREFSRNEKGLDRDRLLRRLEQDVAGALGPEPVPLNTAPTPPTVLLVVGVNGTGKTTTIAKLAKMLANDGKKVLLAASDTFRAAAIDQLAILAERAGASIVKHQPGGDAAAVAFDAAEASAARGIDFLIIDTAGRLHTKVNLMEEIKKVRRVIAKKIAGAPHEVLLVLDATTGQNALQQAKMFHEALGLTGIVMAKLDGTARGGILLGIKEELDIPIKFVGIGEKLEDLEPFVPSDFARALFGQ
jgi:fused signal recognition particle receptor